MKRRLVIGIAVVCVLSALNVRASAPQAPKLSVNVSVSGGSSTVLSALAYQLREQLRKSSRYADAPLDTAVIYVSLIGVDPDKREGEGGGNRTIVSVCMTMRNHVDYKPGDPQTWYPIYLDHSIVTVGSNRTADMALTLMGDIDSAWTAYVEDAQKTKER